jgi:hypothetical protein
MAQVKLQDRGWVDAKWFGKSWTIWLNLIAIVIPVLDFVLKTNLIADKDIYALLLAILNILLRFKTKEPISLER